MCAPGRRTPRVTIRLRYLPDLNLAPAPTATRPPTALQLHQMRWRRELELLIADIRHTAAALDLARATLARRDGRWGFAGGNPRRHSALTALSHRSLCRTIPELARELRCSRQAAHRLTIALARRGLVSVEPIRDDRRVLYIDLTSAGKRALADAEYSANTCLDAIGDCLDIREMRALGTALHRIRERAAALRTADRRR